MSRTRFDGAWRAGMLAFLLVSSAGTAQAQLQGRNPEPAFRGQDQKQRDWEEMQRRNDASMKEIERKLSTNGADGAAKMTESFSIVDDFISWFMSWWGVFLAIGVGLVAVWVGCCLYLSTKKVTDLETLAVNDPWIRAQRVKMR